MTGTGSGATISSRFLAFLQSVDGDVREKEWVLAASAFLVVSCHAHLLVVVLLDAVLCLIQGNKLTQELDLVGLSFGDLGNLEKAEPGQRSWIKRCLAPVRVCCITTLIIARLCKVHC